MFIEKIAIVGGSGFIGFHLSKELIRRKKEVFNFDINTSNNLDEVFFIDISKTSFDELVYHFSLMDCIIDLAYTTNPKTSFDDPVVDIIENLPNTVKLLSIANQLPNIKRFLFVSSGGTVYGNTGSKLIKESHMNSPISPYGITKLAIEKYGLMYYHTNNLPFVVARPSNAYGIGQKANTGQGFIRYAIDCILNDKEITIFGNKGTIRDYIYVTDISSALADIIEHSESGEVYNIGTGIGKSNLDIVNILRPLSKNIGKEIKINHLPLRNFDVLNNVLDCRKLKEISDWSPVIDIKSGIKMTWDWVLNNG
jgi:UDP-glucose 4-epimerase